MCTKLRRDPEQVSATSHSLAEEWEPTQEHACSEARLPAPHIAVSEQGKLAGLHARVVRRVQALRSRRAAHATVARLARGIAATRQQYSSCADKARTSRHQRRKECPTHPNAATSCGPGLRRQHPAFCQGWTVLQSLALLVPKDFPGSTAKTHAGVPRNQWGPLGTGSICPSRDLERTTRHLVSGSARVPGA